MKSFNRIRKLNQVVSETIDELGISNIVVADVATDHGYLAELLSRNDKISKVFATDISQKCLDKTNELKEKFNLRKIETRLGDGLEPIDRADVTILSGIGGYEIIRILDNQNVCENKQNKCNVFVLQPSKNAEDLRLWIIDKNVEIVRDFIVFSGGKYYPIIVVNFTKKSNTEKSIFNVYFGKSNSFENFDFIGYLKDLITRMNFLEKMDYEEIKSSNDLKTKFEIFNLAKRIINKAKGE